MNSFKPKSIDELNAAFEQKLAEIKEEREKEIAQDNFLSEEQKEFYKITDDEPEETETEIEPEETEIQPEHLEEETQDIPEEEDVEEETEDAAEEIEEDPEDTAESDEIEEPDEETAEAPEAEYTQSEEPEEVNELFEAERLAQQEAELYEANTSASEEALEYEPEEQAEESAENEAETAEDTAEEAFEEEKAEEKQETPVFYFKENAQDLRAEENETVSEPEETAEEQPVYAPKKEFEEVKLTRTKDVKAEKRKNKKNKNNEEKEAKETKVKTPKNHKTAKTVLNTLISLLIIACVIVNGFVFMADMPKRFIANTGVTVCEHTVEGSNINSGSLLFTKKAQTAEDNKIVAALTKDKKTVVDFKQNIPADAEIYAKTVKLVPRVGGAIKFVRNYWFQSGLIELSVLLVLLIARVVVSDKKEKPETNKKNK